MASLADYLRDHVVGEILESKSVLDFFSTDGSILKMRPGLVIYPQNISDVRKTVRCCYKLAEKGQVIPITARGAGTDVSGASLNESGILLVTPPHLNKVLTLDTNHHQIVVHPGLNFQKIQDILKTHGQYIPVNINTELVTIGGMIANNESGNSSFKNGSIKNYVSSLEVVLANGDTIITGRISKKELSARKAQGSFEASIYRELDLLLIENQELLQTLEPETSKNSSGYNLTDIKHPDGSFDLTPLFVGSQGTLGIVVGATLITKSYAPQSTLLVGGIEELDLLQQSINELKKLSPLSITMVDKNLLLRTDRINSSALKQIIESPYPNYLLLVEFDEPKIKKQTLLTAKAAKILETFGTLIASVQDIDEREKYQKIATAYQIITSSTAQEVAADNKSSIPVIDDVAVPIDRFAELIEAVYTLFKSSRLDVAIWSNAGDGNINVLPKMDLSTNLDRQKVIRLMDSYYKIVLSLGGTISASSGDGRIKTPYLRAMYDDQEMSLFESVKKIFDPFNYFNPGVKTTFSKRDILYYMRHDNQVNNAQNLPF